MAKDTISHTIDKCESIELKEETRIRLIHTVRISFSKALRDVEEIVNNEIIRLARKGCKIVSIQSKQVCVNPIYLFYEIVYEPGENITKELLNGKDN